MIEDDRKLCMIMNYEYLIRKLIRIIDNMNLWVNTYCVNDINITEWIWNMNELLFRPQDRIVMNLVALVLWRVGGDSTVSDWY